ncbi:hypothetical protein SAY87_003370 [Trapa incisa]|uniref:Uncharacterized protein n=2 Tax=Trapa TaxID=22665 RepID=A0AAN7QTN1_TRANT|nr:hypothetical protein SAY87_003370 [Trapa incisa]KAK4779359.1 hypothetical protein SAY86_006887 [Trapa natans]
MWSNKQRFKHQGSSQSAHAHVNTPTSLDTQAMASLECDWSQHICPDGSSTTIIVSLWKARRRNQMSLRDLNRRKKNREFLQGVFINRQQLSFLMWTKCSRTCAN